MRVSVLGIVNIFSKRTKKNENIFTYDTLNSNFRVQVIQILLDSIGKYNKQDSWGHGGLPSNNSWDYIHKTLCKEYGVFRLSDKGDTSIEHCLYFIQETTVDKVLDIIELSIRFITNVVSNWSMNDKNKSYIIQNANDAVFELNERFKEHGIGYQFIEGQIIRVDSEYIFNSAVEPAVKLLFTEGFEGASEEFLSAHEHYKRGRNKEAITDALKAFESVMKTICKRMKWEVNENATAKPLIDTLFKNELIPNSLQNQFNSLRTTLESGLPTVRNKNSGHGQGEKSKSIPSHLVAYSLHLCATNILFLIESYNQIK